MAAEIQREYDPTNHEVGINELKLGNEGQGRVLIPNGTDLPRHLPVKGPHPARLLDDEARERGWRLRGGSRKVGVARFVSLTQHQTREMAVITWPALLAATILM